MWTAGCIPPPLPASPTCTPTHTLTHTLITQLIINQRLGSILSSLQMREHPTAEKSPKKAGLTTKKKKKRLSTVHREPISNVSSV